MFNMDAVLVTFLVIETQYLTFTIEGEVCFDSQSLCGSQILREKQTWWKSLAEDSCSRHVGQETKQRRKQHGKEVHPLSYLPLPTRPLPLNSKSGVSLCNPVTFQTGGVLGSFQIQTIRDAFFFLNIFGPCLNLWIKNPWVQRAVYPQTEFFENCQ